MRGAADKKTKMERLNFLDFQGNVTKPASLPRAFTLSSSIPSSSLMWLSTWELKRELRGH